jgi:error-prone DNA polymerase
MRQPSADRIAEARQHAPFQDLQDLSNRANLDRHDLNVLAEANALRALAGHRHRARWETAAVEKPTDDLLSPPTTKGVGKDGNQSPAQAQATTPDTAFTGSMRTGSSQRSATGMCPPGNVPEKAVSGVVAGLNRKVSIRPPTQADTTRADYASTALTLGPHPVALIRSVLRRRRAITARELHQKPHGTRVRACGLITMRQRPATASGTLFLTLEDETGHVNAVIWPRLFEKQRAEILGASLLAVDGVLETDGDVHHLIASRVFDFSELSGTLRSRSRDFC